MSKSEMVLPQHLKRKAVIYVRQSRPNQVLTNQESLRLQYALKERAKDLGWQAEDIEIVDADLGLTASAAQHREGFKEILTKVTLGQVGIILSYEVTRLSRNCTDWFPLLDICAYKKCLIADRDGIYDPGAPNDRLLLGIKGQISELELHTLRGRLTAGILSKASRGELALKLPPGLVRNEDGKVVKNPNLEVQHRIELIFEKFLQLRSASKVLRFLNERNLLIPRREGHDDVVWKKPSVSSILFTLKNPAYAGAFTYGRTRSTRNGSSPTNKFQKRLPMQEWKVKVDNKYPCYINWKTFEQIQAMIQDNHAEYSRNKTRGIPRAGAALLHGLVYCGECSHKMMVQYKGISQYLCNQLRQQYGVPVCQLIQADPIDAKVVELFFQATSPIELDLYSKALEKKKEQDEKLERIQSEQLERLRYQVTLAQRQFNRADPDNRLVTAELEKRWEIALKEFKEAELEYQQRRQNTVKVPPLSPEIKATFCAIGKRLPDLWSQSVLTREQKKALLRSLIDKVVINRRVPDQVHTRIVWRGGDSTTIEIPVSVGSFANLSNFKEMETQVLQLTKQGVVDDKIAQQLTSLGYRSPMKSYVLPSSVRSIRLKHRLFQVAHQSHPRRIAGYLTISQVAEAVGVKLHWIYDRIHNGSIHIKQNVKNKMYLFPNNATVLAKIKKLKNGDLKQIRIS